MLTGELEEVGDRVPADLFRHIPDEEVEALATAAGEPDAEAAPPPPSPASPAPEPPVEPPTPPEPKPAPPPPPPRESPAPKPDPQLQPTRIRVHDDRLDQRAEPLDLSPSEALRLAQEGRAALRRRPPAPS